jgi:Raf kinase inhibitor-like YbhB/YbcL family protein
MFFSFLMRGFFLSLIFMTFTTLEAMTMEIKSSAFTEGKPIPQKYTCKGADISPPLIFSNIPSGAKSLALIVDDPDAPSGTFDHWIAWNIPPTTTSLPEGAKLQFQGKNSYSVNHYRGPCPPPGKPHRYFFKIYALDTTFNLPQGITKHQLESAMEGHIFGKSELIGTFQK